MHELRTCRYVSSSLSIYLCMFLYSHTIRLFAFVHILIRWYKFDIAPIFCFLQMSPCKIFPVFLYMALVYKTIIKVAFTIAANFMALVNAILTIAYVFTISCMHTIECFACKTPMYFCRINNSVSVSVSVSANQRPIEMINWATI